MILIAHRFSHILHQIYIYLFFGLIATNRVADSRINTEIFFVESNGIYFLLSPTVCAISSQKHDMTCILLLIIPGVQRSFTHTQTQLLWIQNYTVKLQENSTYCDFVCCFWFRRDSRVCEVWVTIFEDKQITITHKNQTVKSIQWLYQLNFVSNLHQPPPPSMKTK